MVSRNKLRFVILGPGGRALGNAATLREARREAEAKIGRACRTRIFITVGTKAGDK